MKPLLRTIRPSSNKPILLLEIIDEHRRSLSSQDSGDDSLRKALDARMSVLDQNIDNLVLGALMKQTSDTARPSEHSQYWNLLAGAIDENVEDLQRELDKADLEELQHSSSPAMIMRQASLDIIEENHQLQGRTTENVACGFQKERPGVLL